MVTGDSIEALTPSEEPPGHRQSELVPPRVTRATWTGHACPRTARHHSVIEGWRAFLLPVRVIRENVVSCLHARVACEPALGVVPLWRGSAKVPGLKVSVAAS